MTHEKIFTNNDGSKIKIIVSFSAHSYRNEFDYHVKVHTCAPKKRTFVGTVNTDNYTYRALTMDERRLYEKKMAVQVATWERIDETINELWMKLKPDSFEQYK